MKQLVSVIPPDRKGIFLVGDYSLEVILPVSSLKSVPWKRLNTTEVRDIMTPVHNFRSVPAEKGLVEVLGPMEEDGVDLMPVSSGDRIVGLFIKDGLKAFSRAVSGSKK